MIADIEIRPIDFADAEAVCGLVAQLGYRRTPEEIRHWIDAVRREQRSQTALVACGLGQVLGWIELSIEHRLQAAPFALIGGLVVQEGARNRGIGRALCVRAEEWAWEQGVNIVRVTSRATRVDAHRFYLRDGYREVKQSMVFEKSRPH